MKRRLGGVPSRLSRSVIRRVALPRVRKAAISFRLHRVRERHGGRVRVDRDAVDAEAGGRQGYRRLGSAERPTAAERQIHAQAQLASLLGGEAQVVDELVGEIREVAASRSSGDG